MYEKENNFAVDSIIKNRYLIQRFIARGGMGETYQALDQKIGKEVVLKVVAFNEMENWNKLELFEREIKTLQNIAHPNIPHYVDHFEHEVNGKTYFVLVQEYISGKTLKKLVDTGKKFSVEEVNTLFKTLLEILKYIHEHHPSIIHRDINPKNIILTDRGQVYLVDFGAVGQVVKDTLMGGNTMVGTMGYMPQEQLYGKALPASDLYALALTVIFMLTGKDPANFELKNMKPNFHPFVNIPEALLKLLDKMCEADVNKRPQSAAQVLEILERKVSLIDYESLINQIPEEVKIEQQENTKIITIPNKGPLRFLAVFLSFFAIAWNSIIWFIAFQIPREAFFVYFFLIPFFAVGIGFPVAALYIFFGKTEFRLSSNALSFSKVLFNCRFRTKKLELAEIYAIDLQDTNSATNQRSQSLLIQGKRRSIKYNNQNILWLDLTPVKKIMELYVQENK